MAAKKGKEAMPVRAYSYLRFSSACQAAGDSRRRQESLAADVCRDLGAVLDESLTISDFGASAFRGKHAAEGGLSVFLQAVEQGRVSPGSVLIVEKLDRLSRETVSAHLALFIRLLNAGIVIITAEPRRTYTQESVNNVAELLEAIIYMAAAHDESKKKSDRLKHVWAEKRRRAAADGTPVSSSCPAWITLNSRGYALLTPAVETVRHIVRGLSQGSGLVTLVKELNENPERFPCFNPSARWTTSYVRKIACRAALWGAYQPMRVGPDGRRVPLGEPIPGYYPAVCTKEEADAAMAAMRGRNRKGGRNGTHCANLFTGIAYEATTRAVLSSYRLAPRNGRTYRYLCPQTKRHSSPTASGIGFRYEAFEEAVLAALSELRAVDVMPAGEACDEREDRIAKLTREVVTLDGRLQALEIQAADPRFADSALPHILKAMDEISRKKARASEELGKLKADSLSAGREESLGAVQSVIAMLDAARGTKEEVSLRRRVKHALRQLLDEVWVYSQVVSRQSRILHVRIYLKGGRQRYLCVLPERDSPEVRPLDLQACDFRAGDIKDVARNAG